MLTNAILIGDECEYTKRENSAEFNFYGLILIGLKLFFVRIYF